MNKIITLMTFTFILFGCNKGNDNTLGSHSVEFNLPIWIIGTWNDDFEINSYSFSSDNIVLNISESPNPPIDFKRAYAREIVTENINTDNEYNFTITMNGLIQTYGFIKQSDTTLTYYLITAGDSTGQLVLTKE